MDRRMRKWIDERLDLAQAELDKARARHDKMMTWREQIRNGRPSLDCDKAFWSWACMQPKQDANAEVSRSRPTASVADTKNV